jgi:hypothetical protein
MSAVQQSIDPQWLDNGPAFSEPWQAEAFALTLQLARAGHFSWTDWVGTFSMRISTPPITVSGCRRWKRFLPRVPWYLRPK